MAKKEKIQYPNPEVFRCKDEINWKAQWENLKEVGTIAVSYTHLLGVAVIAHGVLIDIVQQVEVEVLNTALFELLLTDRFGAVSYTHLGWRSR